MDSTASRYDGGCHQSARRSVLETSQRRFTKSSPAPSRTQSSRQSSAFLHSLGQKQSCRPCDDAIARPRIVSDTVTSHGGPTWQNSTASWERLATHLPSELTT